MQNVNVSLVIIPFEPILDILRTGDRTDSD